MKLAVSVVLLITLLVMPAFADWTVTNLNPNGASDSYAFAVSGNKQVGNAIFNNVQHAGVWSGTASSWVDLNPAGSSQSQARGISGSKQVGYAYINGKAHAGMWSGTANSWSDLQPQDADESYAFSVSGSKAVGYAMFGNTVHSGTWDTITGDWTDMSTFLPNGTQLVSINSSGSMVGSSSGRAGMWDKSSNSWIDLHPSGATSSWAESISDDCQVGWAIFDNGQTYKVGMWRGNASSWTDLTPTGANFCYGLGTDGDVQVGGFSYNNIHAGMWSGSADSSIDLHALLPAGEYINSAAYGVDVWGESTSIVGWAEYSSHQAMLWKTGTQPVPEPTSLLALAGLLAPMGAGLIRKKVK